MECGKRASGYESFLTQTSTLHLLASFVRISFLPEFPYARFRQRENRLGRYQITRLLISGSQVRALVRPPRSLPKLALEDLPPERLILGRFFAIGEGGSCVSAYSSRLLGTFWGACLRRQKSRSWRQLVTPLEIMLQRTICKAHKPIL